MSVYSDYIVSTDSAVVAHAGKSNEMIIEGLQSIALPLGFSANTVTASAMGEQFSAELAAGATFESVQCDYNFVEDDDSQDYLRQAFLDSTNIQDMRFYTKYDTLCGDFAAPDLISDSDAGYRIGTFSNPKAGINALFAGSVTIMPGGVSGFFSFHASGTDLSFVANAGSGSPAQIASSTQDFVALGFVAGQTIYLDHVNSLDPLCCQIGTVTAHQIDLEEAVGDEADVPTFSGIASSAIHAATPMAASTSSTCS